MYDLPRSTIHKAEQWFGAEFSQLHPLLQELHRNGGRLSGVAEVKLHPLFAGLIKSRLGVRHGENQLQVDIEHVDNGFYWRRTFNQQKTLSSFFQPIGSKQQGHWLEQTGAIRLHLGVDVIDGGWYWRPMAYRLLGFNIPRWLMPKIVAYKRVDGERYEFFVSVSLPVIGILLEYRGKLAVVSVCLLADTKMHSDDGRP